MPVDSSDQVVTSLHGKDIIKTQHKLSEPGMPTLFEPKVV